MQTPMQQAAAAGKGRRGKEQVFFLILLVVAAFVVYKITTATRVPTLAGPPGWTIYQDPTNGWTMKFPSGWRAIGIKDYMDQMYDTAAWGVLIVNVEGGFGKLPGVGQFDMHGMPATLVALEVASYLPHWAVVPCTDTPTPLNLLRATRTTTATGAKGTTQLKLETGFKSHGKFYRLEAWIGSRASKADRARLDRMVASISFAGAKRAKGLPGVGCSDGEF